MYTPHESPGIATYVRGSACRRQGEGASSPQTENSVGADGMAYVRIDKRASTPSNADARSIQLVTRSAEAHARREVPLLKVLPCGSEKWRAPSRLNAFVQPCRRRPSDQASPPSGTSHAIDHRACRRQSPGSPPWS